MSETKLRIHTWPDGALKRKCRKAEKVDIGIKELLEEMFALMRARGGAGLAANQAGLDLSLIVIEADGRIFKLVNPRIARKQGSISFLEGCLSFPGLELEVKRANEVLVLAQDENGTNIEIEAKGFLAVVFQHEIDHIEGTVFIDRISLWQRLKIYPKLKKISAGAKNGMLK